MNSKNPWAEAGKITELEWRLQEATASYLTGEVWGGNKIIRRHPIPFHHLKFHHPALEYRGAEDGAKYKKRGTTRGIPDWLFWGPNKFHGMIELKTISGKLSPYQKNVEGWAKEYGFEWALCRSVKELRDTIIGWGFKCHNMACIEPDHRTPEQKKRDSFDFYRTE